MPLKSPKPIWDGSGVPQSFVRETDRDIPDRAVCFYEGPGYYAPRLRKPLPADFITKLVARRDALLAALAPAENPANSPHLQLAIVLMIHSFSTIHGFDDETTASIALGYLHIVSARPPWAIKEGALRIRQGRHRGRNGFCPSEPEFSTLVAEIVAPYEDRLRRINGLLAAPVALSFPREPRKAPAGPKSFPLDTGYAARAMADLAARKAAQMDGDACQTETERAA